MYLDFFGLHEAPFTTTADPRWLFAAPSYEAARATVALGIGDRRGLLCVLGEAGTGKTMLLRDLLHALPSRVRPVTLLHPAVTSEEVLEHVATTLGVSLEGLPASRHLDELRRAVANEAARGGNAVLFIDEAQAVPVSTLTALRHLCDARSGGGLQVVLAGQPVLEERLAEAGLADVVVVRAWVEALSSDEVAGYVRSRLAAAGVTASIFSPAALARIARVTRGVPRMVNTIADASLMAAFSARATTVTPEHVVASWKAYVRFGPTGAPVARRQPIELAAEPAPIEPPPPAALGPPRRAAAPSPWMAAGAIALVVAVSAVILLIPAWWPESGPPPPLPGVDEVGPRQPAALAILPTPFEALDVVDAFRRAYEARDSARLGELLAPDAVDDGRTGSANLVAAHGRVLQGLDDVVYLQPDARLEPRGGMMEVRAPFVIRYRERAGGSGEVHGTAVWEISRRGGVPRIVALTHQFAPGTAPMGGGALPMP